MTRRRRSAGAVRPTNVEPSDRSTSRQCLHGGTRMTQRTITMTPPAAAPARARTRPWPSKAQRLLVTIRRGHVTEVALGGDLVSAVVLALAACPLGYRGRLPLTLLDLVFGHTLVLHPFAAAVLCTGS